MQTPQEPPTRQPAFPGPTYGAPPPAYGAPVPPYGAYAPSYPVATPAPQVSGFAIASLVLSLASFFIIPFIGGVVGVIMGHMARGEIRRSNGWKTGGGLATGGLIIGYIHIALCVVAIFFFILLLIAFSSDACRTAC